MLKWNPSIIPHLCSDALGISLGCSFGVPSLADPSETSKHPPHLRFLVTHRRAVHDFFLSYSTLDTQKIWWTQSSPSFRHLGHFLVKALTAHTHFWATRPCWSTVTWQLARTHMQNLSGIMAMPALCLDPSPGFFAALPRSAYASYTIPTFALLMSPLSPGKLHSLSTPASLLSYP